MSDDLKAKQDILRKLREEGLLSEEAFEAKQREILGREPREQASESKSEPLASQAAPDGDMQLESELPEQSPRVASTHEDGREATEPDVAEAPSQDEAPERMQTAEPKPPEANSFLKNRGVQAAVLAVLGYAACLAILNLQERERSPDAEPPRRILRALEHCATADERACDKLLAWIAEHERSALGEDTILSTMESACEAEVTAACIELARARSEAAVASSSMDRVTAAIDLALYACELQELSEADCPHLSRLRARRASLEAAEAERVRQEQERARQEQERARAAERQERLDRLRNQARNGQVNCGEWVTHTSVPRRVCDALADTISEGRTSTASRNALREYLRDRGLRKIRGYIIARIDSGVYEAVMRGYDEYWGVSYPRGQHFLLFTNFTQYSSRGTFNLWVTKTGTRDVPLQSGFTETWDLYTESTLGSRWQAVRDARAGRPTSAAARDLLLFLGP
jgi:hypothetical protein